MENTKRRLACHIYCMRFCKFGSECRQEHPSPKPFCCPNGRRCRIDHSTIRCPYANARKECEQDCSYQHHDSEKGRRPATATQSKREAEKNGTYRRDDQADKISPEVKEKSKIVWSKASMAGWDLVTPQVVPSGNGNGLKEKQVAPLSARASSEREAGAARSRVIARPLEKVPEKIEIEEQQPQKMEIEKVNQPVLQQAKQAQVVAAVAAPVSAPAAQEQKPLSENEWGHPRRFEEKIAEIHQDLQIFEPYRARMQKRVSTDLDLMFIMDCTGSMSSWIAKCKDELKNIIAHVKSQHEGVSVRIAFIGYRDICDKENEFSIKGFTEDIDGMTKFIGGIQASGGGDEPEDIAGGLELAIAQEWRSKTRYAVLICDAPCHGKKYHNGMHDDHPNGDPKGRNPEAQVAELAKMGISLYAVRITGKTGKMYTMFSEAYSRVSGKAMEVANLGNSTNALAFFIANTVCTTISTSVLGTEANFMRDALRILRELRGTKQLTFENFERAVAQELGDGEGKVAASAAAPVVAAADELHFENLMFEDPQWHSLQNSYTSAAVCHTFFIVKDKDVEIDWKRPLLQNSQIKTTVTICKTPFAQGAMRYAFYAYDEVLEQNLVAKLPKVLSRGYDLDTLKKDLESVFICQHLVNEFNERVIPHVTDTRSLLNFVHCFIYELPKSNRYSFYQAENHITGGYEKYNNNAGWATHGVSESAQISQAFSHFSWQLTQGFLMVVDLQGVAGVLTDPQIHCLDYKRFGSGNLGYEGILKFFFSHKCNKYCSELGLKHPAQVQANNSVQEENFYNRQRAWDRLLSRSQKINTLCDLCRQPFQMSAKDLRQKIDNAQEKYCDPCDEKRRNSMRAAKCTNCRTQFRSSEYWFLMKRTDFPELCGECRRARRERMRNALQKE